MAENEKRVKKNAPYTKGAFEQFSIAKQNLHEEADPTEQYAPYERD